MMKTAIFLILAALALAHELTRASEWNLDSLMHALAAVRSDHARFTEIKSIAMLDKPVESSGELYYVAPSHLEKRTLKPRPESLTVDKDSLIMERNGQMHRLQLQKYPEIAAFIDSIRGTLSGDRDALEKNYRASLTGTPDQWMLILLPVEPKMQKVARQIRIKGERDALSSIEILQADGDSSVMTIERLTKP